ncbi:MAG TPA: NAD(P)H-binding protein [Mycobacteriales bacterium]|nr:NAD(P)H-binding protein [Mycobacteriales bacterium]
MRIAIVGGTGTLGRQVAAELGSRGHEVRILSRSAAEFPIDLRSGDGLEFALAGCDVVVDASNAQKKSADTLVEGSRTLLAAEKKAGVGHHVCVSIVGCDLIPTGYFQVKADQERVVAAGPVPWTIVRATQFHELMAQTLQSMSRLGILPLPHAAMRTIASAEVAAAVADAALSRPLRSRIDVVGPEQQDLRELARTWRKITGRRPLLLPIRLPGKLGKALRDGAAVTDRPDVRGRTTFANWLAAER